MGATLVGVIDTRGGVAEDESAFNPRRAVVAALLALSMAAARRDRGPGRPQL